MLECWGVRVLGCWSVGICWNDGALLLLQLQTCHVLIGTCPQCAPFRLDQLHGSNDVVLSWKTLELWRAIIADWWQWIIIWILIMCLKHIVLDLIVTEHELRVLIKPQWRDPALEFVGLTKLIEKHCFLECEAGT